MYMGRTLRQHQITQFVLFKEVQLPCLASVSQKAALLDVQTSITAYRLQDTEPRASCPVMTRVSSQLPGSLNVTSHYQTSVLPKCVTDTCDGKHETEGFDTLGNVHVAGCSAGTATFLGFCSDHQITSSVSGAGTGQLWFVAAGLTVYWAVLARMCIVAVRPSSAHQNHLLCMVRWVKGFV